MNNYNFSQKTVCFDRWIEGKNVGYQLRQYQYLCVFDTEETAKIAGSLRKYLRPQRPLTDEDRLALKIAFR